MNKSIDSERLTMNEQRRELSVCVATVTYGDRFHLLAHMVHSAFHCGVSQIIIVDNGSTSTSREKLKVLASKWGERIKLISLPMNRGSAGGFRRALEIAQELEKDEYIWVLDDDNAPQPQALQVLRATYEQIASTEPRDNFALLSIRPTHKRNIESCVEITRGYPRRGSFFGFHLLDVTQKIMRRIRPSPCERENSLPDVISVPQAPYSGLFFHRSVLKRIGLPNDDYVLYADDTEFSSRLTFGGGTIYLVPNSIVDDIEPSWNTNPDLGNSFDVWLLGGSDFRAYYAARNHAHFERIRSTQPLVRGVNRLVYLTILGFFALWRRQWPRFRLVLRAVREGEQGKLGMSKEYPLP